jgi:chromosome partitioning protein
MAPVVEGLSDPADRGRAIFERLRGDVATDEVEAAPAPASPSGPVEPPRPVLYDDEAVELSDSPEEPTAAASSVPRETSSALTASEAAVPRETAQPPDAPAPSSLQLPKLSEGELELPVPSVPAPPAAAVAGPAAPEQPEVAPSPFLRALPRVMAVANQKGGVGKTTTAVNLGACLAEIGYRVLVCDLDPQGNASTGLGLNPRNMQTSMYDVILNDVPLEDCVEPTSVRNLFVAPASLDLAGAEIELVPAFSRELRLKRAIEAAADDYDFVLIDCPPSLGLLTVNGLAAATEVVVPIQCEYYALEGLGQLLRNVALVQKNLNPRLEVSAIICVMYDARTKLSDQVVQEVRAHFGDKVCRNVVPRTVRLSEAPSFGQPIIAFDPTSRGAIAYRELAKEVSGGAPQRTR